MTIPYTLVLTRLTQRISERNKKSFTTISHNNQDTQQMEKIIAEIKAQVNAILADIEKVDNKAAKARVRKATLALEKVGKEYRKASLK